MNKKLGLGLGLMALVACGTVEGTVSCSSDAECLNGQICGAATKVCEAKGGNTPQPATCTSDAQCLNGQRCDVAVQKCVANGVPQPQPDMGGGADGGGNNPQPQPGPTRVFRIKFEVTPRTAAGNVGRRYCEGSPTLSGSRAWNGPFTPWVSGDISWRSFGNDIFASRATYLAEVTIPASNAATGQRNGMRFQCYDSNPQNGAPDVVTYGVDPRGDSVTVTEVVNGSEVARSYVRVANAPMGEGVNGAVD